MLLFEIYAVIHISSVAGRKDVCTFAVQLSNFNVHINGMCQDCVTEWLLNYYQFILEMFVYRLIVPCRSPQRQCRKICAVSKSDG